MKNTLITLASITALAASADAQNLLTNGSFEADSLSSSRTFVVHTAGAGTLSGWTVTTGNVDVNTGYHPLATDGNNVLDLSGTAVGGISQTIATTAGNTYSLTFDYGSNVEYPIDTALLNVTGASSLISETLAPTTSPFRSYSNSFVANSATTTIDFSSLSTNNTGFGGVFLDNVSVSLTSEAVPEPSSIALLGLGTLGLLARRKR